MRIAQIAPLYEAVPPRLYGGTERIVAHLTDALVELGHEVTLFASAEARTRPRWCRCAIRPSGSIPPRSSPISRRICRCCTSCTSGGDEFDVLHFHVDLIHFPFFAEHRRADRDHAARPARPQGPAGGLCPLAATIPLVSISDDQRTPLPDANWLATIPHGLAESVYTFNAAPSEPGYLAFLGRISPEKRPGPGDRDRQALGPAAEDRRQGRRRGSRPISTRSSSRCSTIP